MEDLTKLTPIQRVLSTAMEGYRPGARGEWRSMVVAAVVAGTVLLGYLMR